MTIVLQVVNFLLFAGVLIKFGFKPVINQIDARREQVRDTLAKAESVEKEAAQLKGEYEKKLQNVESQVSELINNAMQHGETMKREILDQAHENACRLKERAEGEISIMKENAYSEIGSHIGDMAVSVAAKLLEESLDSSTQKKLVDDFIKKVESGDVG